MDVSDIGVMGAFRTLAEKLRNRGTEARQSG